jgi:hypothetical protein
MTVFGTVALSHSSVIELVALKSLDIAAWCSFRLVLVSRILLHAAIDCMGSFVVLVTW